MCLTNRQLTTWRGRCGGEVGWRSGGVGSNDLADTVTLVVCACLPVRSTCTLLLRKVVAGVVARYGGRCGGEVGWRRGGVGSLGLADPVALVVCACLPVRSTCTLPLRKVVAGVAYETRYGRRCGGGLGDRDGLADLVTRVLAQVLLPAPALVGAVVVAVVVYETRCGGR